MPTRHLSTSRYLFLAAQLHDLGIAELERTMTLLARNRPIFHSEADFRIDDVSVR
jgi:hypothetical protein